MVDDKIARYLEAKDLVADYGDYKSDDFNLTKSLFDNVFYSDPAKPKTLENIEKDIALLELPEIQKLRKFSHEMREIAVNNMVHDQSPRMYSRRARVALLNLTDGNYKFSSDEWAAWWQILGSAEDLNGFSGSLNGGYFNGDKETYMYFDPRFLNEKFLNNYPDEKREAKIWAQLNGMDSDSVTFAMRTEGFKNFNPSRKYEAFRIPSEFQPKTSQ